ncbi:acyltransferase-like protein At3g26840, chloroplastic isoform X1 [Eucalyptus grandis]|uniref:acyltransferase-like protein At3g26840, chloroplastic isoform X1 n=1 Tax=Eucalyptus grandis TaxID=71139 RepID=UPI00192E7642|nr:acyltransferase-like protein At3g26840, chloroplastic isoform X1 [Eucalyptus grandis]
MAATGACLLPPGVSPAPRLRGRASAAASSDQNPRLSSSLTRGCAVSKQQAPSALTGTTIPRTRPVGEHGRRYEKSTSYRGWSAPFMEDVELESGPDRVKRFFDHAKDLARPDGGPPRWFSPLECGSRSEKSPLLLYLPGIDDTGAGLTSHHKKLGKIFDIWCLHIPVMDRTSFRDLVKMIERTIKSENYRSPNRPIYLVGESLGGCLALAVAARNPDIDLLLILANPATSFDKSQIQALLPLLELMPEQLQLTYPFILSFMAGDPSRKFKASTEEGLAPQRTVEELSKDLLTMSSHVSVLADILPKETLLWKLQMLKSASAYSNSRIHDVNAQTLLLTSAKDWLLPSQAEGARLNNALRRSHIRKFEDCGHYLFLEDDFDLVTIIKRVGFYRRGKCLDYVSDYLPPTPAEYRKVYESNRWFNEITGPVMLSTLEDGRIVRGLDGIPSEGPVLYVGYHMLLGLELVPLVTGFMNERNILLRGIAHPMIFENYEKGQTVEPEYFDNYRIMGAVPVSGTNLFKLLSSKSHVLLYPGGMREALHRKGEEYKLIWPEQSEFVRMAIKFGAKIVPFGTVGEDDFGEVFFDYDDQMKIPYFRNWIQQLTENSGKVRSNATGEVANQDVHLPWIRPKVPGRFYFCFGKPIETAGRREELKDREKCHELYLQIKSEVESCMVYLREKRESDPYRSIFSRLMYQATHNSASKKIPTFEL